MLFKNIRKNTANMNKEINYLLKILMLKNKKIIIKNLSIFFLVNY